IMMKLLGALLIVLASTLFGFYRAQNFAQRPRQIRQLIHALKRLATEIHYGGTPLPDAMRKLALHCSNPLNRFFAAIADRLTHERTATVREVWHEQVRQIWGQTAMKAPEREALLELGTTLGVSDREDQLKHLELTQTLLQ